MSWYTHIYIFIYTYACILEILFCINNYGTLNTYLFQNSRFLNGTIGRVMQLSLFPHQPFSQGQSLIILEVNIKLSCWQNFNLYSSSFRDSKGYIKIWPSKIITKYKMVYFIENKITHLKYTVSPENPVQVLECSLLFRCVICCGNVQKNY